MSSNRITGTNFSLIDGVVDFFGAKAMRTNKFSAVNIDIGEDVMIQIIPDTITVEESILGCIKDDTDAGKRDKIAYAIVGIRAAAALYLLDIITAEHLRNATEGDNYVDIPGIVFDGLSLTVRVDPSRDYIFCATADKDCVIIV